MFLKQALQSFKPLKKKGYHHIKVVIKVPIVKQCFTFLLGGCMNPWKLQQQNSHRLKEFF